MLQLTKMELLPDTVCALVRNALFLSSWSICVIHFMVESRLLRATFTLNMLLLGSICCKPDLGLVYPLYAKS